MNKYFFTLPFALLLACGNKESKNAYPGFRDISIQVDTIMVDSKGEILMAAVKGSGAAYSPDFKMLYSWDFESSQVEFIDLVDLKLIEKRTFEKEGPNGVGNNSYLMRRYGEGQFAFIGWDNKIAIVDQNGTVIQRIGLDESWILDGIDERGSVSFLGFSEDGQKLYGSFTNFQKIDPDLLELDLQTKTRRIIPLPEFEKLDDFRISFVSEDGSSRSMSHPSVSIFNWNGKLLIYSSALNRVYRFDASSDSLVLLRYESKLTANEKTGTYKNNVDSQEELQKEAARLSEEISFGRLIWDSDREVFYRFSFFYLPKVGEEERNLRSFLSVLSANLELLGEKETTELGLGFPNPQFAKDGKLYLLLNLDDELAYVRMGIE